MTCIKLRGTTYELDCAEISRIQFHTDLPQRVKNQMIGLLEKRMEIQEQLELDGQGMGYYTQ
tara:strand:- start:451 stop:636 length:186 start_codon:yes stop_codon:yes gene_type:complete